MAIVRIPEQGRTLKTKEAITEYLASINIEYQTWTPEQPTSAEATQEEILADFPDLQAEDIQASIAYAARYLDHSVLVST